MAARSIIKGFLLNASLLKKLIISKIFSIRMATTQYFLYALIFVIGVVVGRLSMAVQYAFMKKYSRKL